MLQTVEAINHAQAAGVPMVFAITKIDKPQANPEKIKEGLANMNILVEDWGGKYQCQEIDAKHGTNVNELLDVFNLFEIDGYSHLEISQMTGSSYSTVRSQLFKAKRALKKKIEEHLGELMKKSKDGTPSF